MTNVFRDLAPSGVRKGTLVFVSLNHCPSDLTSPNLERGPRGKVYLRPIESLHPGDYVLTHTNRFHRVLALSQSEYQGPIIGIRKRGCNGDLWITPAHAVATPLPSLPESKVNVETTRRLRREATHSERMLWHALRRDRLGHKFRRQHPLGPFILDFFCSALRLAVEVDGSIHNLKEQAAYDRFRQEMIENYGVCFLRVTNEEVEMSLETTVAKLVAVTTERMKQVSYHLRWVPAGRLKVGDWLWQHDHLTPIVIEDSTTTETIELVINPTVEEDNSFVTEVCTIHSYVGR